MGVQISRDRSRSSDFKTETETSNEVNKINEVKLKVKAGFGFLEDISSNESASAYSDKELYIIEDAEVEDTDAEPVEADNLSPL